MKIGDTFKRKGETYEIYKIDDYKYYAENEYRTNILTFPILKVIK